MQTTVLAPYIDSDAARQAARAFGQTLGHTGNRGGWIGNDKRAITQGWDNYEVIFRERIRDWVTAQLTAFGDFEQLMNTDERYSPTLRGTTWQVRYLADAFDTVAHKRGQRRRAYRGIVATRSIAAGVRRYHQGAPCVCGHTIEQHPVERCDVQDAICGCMRFRLDGDR